MHGKEADDDSRDDRGTGRWDSDDRATLDRLPVLVVEVLSPSTWGRDEIDKPVELVHPFPVRLVPDELLR